MIPILLHRVCTEGVRYWSSTLRSLRYIHRVKAGRKPWSRSGSQFQPLFCEILYKKDNLLNPSELDYACTNPKS
jgi:hypothetical protein